MKFTSTILFTNLLKHWRTLASLILYLVIRATCRYPHEAKDIRAYTVYRIRRADCCNDNVSVALLFIFLFYLSFTREIYFTCHDKKARDWHSSDYSSDQVLASSSRGQA